MALPEREPPLEGGPPLEVRVVALERAVVDLQDTRVVEERIYQRVVSRLPGAVGSRTNWLSRLNPFRGSSSSVPLPVASGWLIWDMLTEARFLVSMILDPRFSMAWMSRVGMIVCLLLIATAQWWFPLSWFPLVGYWVDKLMTLTLGFFLFKILSRETYRYRIFLQSASASR